MRAMRSREPLGTALGAFLAVSLALPYAEPVMCALEDECAQHPDGRAQQAAFQSSDTADSIESQATVACCYPATGGPLVELNPQALVQSESRAQDTPYKRSSRDRWQPPRSPPPRMSSR
jgi:hypothetical protein